MKWCDWLADWGLDSLKIKLHFIEMEWTPQDADRNAVWDRYIELLTRITTQTLDPAHRNKGTALASVYSIFGLTWLEEK